MNFEKLKKNIIDVIHEQQLKLGYLNESVRLYYPLTSINNLLNAKVGKEEAVDILKHFSQMYTKEFGEISVSFKDKRFCLVIPAKGSEYIHNLSSENSFLHEFIAAVSSAKEIRDLEDIFFKYSSDVTIKYLKDADFDCLMYFTNGIPDSFYYCISKEHSHLTYHRFTKEDYVEMFEN